MCPSQGTDASYLDKLVKQMKKHAHLVPNLDDRAPGGGGFTIKHYAGDVSYSAVGFLEKNKDTLYSDLVTLMRRACNGNATAA